MEDSASDDFEKMRGDLKKKKKKEQEKEKTEQRTQGQGRL